MLEYIDKCFDITRNKPENIGPLKLAYIGDAVYELIIRSIIMDGRDLSVKKLNKEAQQLVNAGTQAKLAKKMLPEFNDTENAIFHRGRNAKNNSMSKHSDIHDYRIATGLEAVFGYWYLSHQTERAVLLLQNAMKESAK
ncbi:MAG: ribonuclease III [Eubacterium sp.]|nr:ribonuclease III [Eubacterium sp.]